MINLTPSIIKVEHTNFIHTHYAYSTKIQSIWLFFQVPLQAGKVTSCLATLLSSLLLVFFCFTLIWFLLVSVIFSWSCCKFFLQCKLVMLSDFPPCRFVRLTNLETCKHRQQLCYEFSPLHQSSQSITSGKVIWKP